MTTQHTPGPWEQKIQGCSIWPICTVYGTEHGWIEIHAPNLNITENPLAESTANARLITAAPDLLEALKEIVTYWDSIVPTDCVNDMHIKARTAIAKATGQQP
jgi:hypothetical protein